MEADVAAGNSATDMPYTEYLKANAAALKISCDALADVLDDVVRQHALFHSDLYEIVGMEHEDSVAAGLQQNEKEIPKALLLY
jgi:hypothetical protein